MSWGDAGLRCLPTSLFRGRDTAPRTRTPKPPAPPQARAHLEQRVERQLQGRLDEPWQGGVPEQLRRGDDAGVARKRHQGGLGLLPALVELPVRWLWWRDEGGGG